MGKGSYGPVASESKRKPSLNIRASVDSYQHDNSEYDNRRKKELKSEIKTIKHHLANFDHKKVAEHVKADLESQLIEKQHEHERLCGKKKLSMM